MAGYTDYEFEQELDADLGWRRIELNHLKSALAQATRDSQSAPAARALSRALVVMCYAHWEGYAKNGLARYGRLVAKRKPALSRANDGFVLQHIRQTMKRVASGDGGAKTELLATLRGKLDPRIHVDKASLSEAKSNLRFDVLVTLFELGCIPLDNFKLKAKFIDVNLCDQRNSVAHGREFFPPPADSMELCQESLALMEELRDTLVTQVTNRKYLASSQSDLNHTVAAH
ncbi:MAG: MAE_28990/MAE_18760 family HEPN-like nuclease [Micropruina sp.]